MVSVIGSYFISTTPGPDQKRILIRCEGCEGCEASNITTESDGRIIHCSESEGPPCRHHDTEILRHFTAGLNQLREREQKLGVQLQ